jgi:hypothetical protein
LTLDKTLELCRAAEAAQQQLRVINSGSGTEQTSFSPVISAVSGSNQAAGNFAPRKQCGNCGTNHAPRSCPAFRKICSSCGKENHFASVCRSTNRPQFNRRFRSQSRSRYQGNQNDRSSVHTVEVNDDQLQYDSLYVGQLSIDTVDKYDRGRGTSWWKVLDINGSSVYSKPDSGAEVNVMPLQTYQTLHT